MQTQTNYSKRSREGAKILKKNREELKTSTVTVKSVIKPFIVKANKADPEPGSGGSDT